VACVVLLAGCGMPRDPEGTLERVAGGTMRVGVTENQPWTAVDDRDQPSGVEVQLVERLAAELGAEVEWVHGSEAELFADLQARTVDLVIGGLTTDNPWLTEAAPTRPYVTTRIVVATLDGTLPDSGIAGLRVAAEQGGEATRLLEKADAIPLPADDLGAMVAAGMPVAVDDWLLDDLGLADTGVHLRERQHVMAVPAGENGWLVELERFLFRQRGRIGRALRAAGAT
jgi:polar amino acid transport system substrate-binding protein